MTLRLPKFQYVAPHTLDEAVGVLADNGPKAMVVAGGTDLYPNMKRRQFTPEVLVGLRGIREMYGIGPLPAGAGPTQSSVPSPQPSFRIGGSATLTEVATSPMIREQYPALAAAAGLVSTPQLRNMGTIGGNICLDTRCNYYDQSPFWRKALGYCMKLEGDVCRVATSSPTCLATFSSDTVPALIGYDASIRLVGPNGARTVPLGDFYRMDGMHWMKIEPGEILSDVNLPQPDGLRATYLKLRDRGSFDFPIAGVFVGVRTDASGVVTRARIILTGVYSMPVPLTDAENALIGKRLEPDVISAAADAAYGGARPVDNTGGTIIQRRRTIRVFIRRALEELGTGPTGAGSQTA
jgi:4-hydroxybenzoyl-CoA reductase subunit beta